VKVPSPVWRVCYEALGARIRTPEWAFMNYGYAPADGEPVPRLDAADEPDRYSIQLYDRALGPVDLAGKDVLEVGSGRGGGTSYLARYLGPRTTTGLDLSTSAVAFCARHRRAPGATFVHGDAQAMPFPDESFDVVVNVESSHCYGSMDDFLAEARRVLRPGGALCWADIRRARAVGRLRAQFRASGLVVADEEDVTAGVLRALTLDNERRLRLIESWIPRPLRPVMRPFAGVEGTTNFVGLQRGDQRYLSARLHKPRSAAAAA
jgi:SAM-dependent methyltransferase